MNGGLDAVVEKVGAESVACRRRVLCVGDADDVLMPHSVESIIDIVDGIWLDYQLIVDE